MNLNSITVTILYDKTLQKITGVAEEKATVSENLPFLYMLNFVFSSYPQIQKQYSPGTIAITVNNKPPSEFDTMNHEDILRLAVYDKKLLN